MSAKKRDKKGRWRCKTVSFRASEEEAKAINEAVALSGLTKYEYIITKLLNRDVVVQGNPRVFIKLKEKMDSIYTELTRIEKAGDLSDEFIESINLVATIYKELIKDKNHGGTE